MNRYTRILEGIFLSKFREGATHLDFDRTDIQTAADTLGVKRPSNLGDVLYSYRYRQVTSAEIATRTPDGHEWIIRGSGKGLYRFDLVETLSLEPRNSLVATKVPDGTPGVVMMHAMGDEQALLAKVRYNRLIDIFTGIVCYSLQNHLRSSVPDIGQVETDEVYVGIERTGCQYVIPVQAKGGNDTLHRVQIEQDIALCAIKFPNLVCLPVAAQFMPDEVVALFSFEASDGSLKIADEKHYKLVPPEDLTEDDLRAYAQRHPRP